MDKWARKAMIKDANEQLITGNLSLKRYEVLVYFKEL